jgi:hypothetical protein
LERHGSGTPNDAAPRPVTVAESLAALTAVLPTFAQATGSIRLWQESLRSKREAA